MQLPEGVGVSPVGPRREERSGVAADWGTGKGKSQGAELLSGAASNSLGVQAASPNGAEVLCPPARTSSRRPSSPSSRTSPRPSNDLKPRPSTSSASNSPFATQLVTYPNGSSSDLTKGLPSLPPSSLPIPQLASTSSSSLSTPPHPSSILRASTASAATSNSSCAPPSPRAFAHVSANPSSSSAALEELDPTAGLIWKLYARLDAQGVLGDGWDEGMERSRDGIINREVAEGLLTVGRGDKGKGPAVEDLDDSEGGELPLREEQILRRVDRFVLSFSP